MGSALPGRVQSPARAIANIVVGLSPVFILTTAFLVILPRLAPLLLGEVSLVAIMVACAIWTPLLSQVVSGPVFTAIVAADAHDDVAMCATSARVIPRLLGVTATVALLVGGAIGLFQGWSLISTGGLLINLFAHLVMAMTMVPGFATRRPDLLLSAWVTYAVGLVIAPGLAWWLPATLTACVQYAVILRIGRHADTPTPPPVHRLLVGLGHGFVDGVPVWILGPIMWVLDPHGFSAGVFFPALVPSLCVYQAFMFVVADPLWNSIGWTNEIVAQDSYRATRPEFVALARRARQGSVGILIAAVGAAAVGVSAAFLGRASDPTALIIVASCAGVSVFALAYQYSIAAGRRPLMIASLIITTIAVVSVVAGVSDSAYLIVTGSVCVVLVAVIAVLCRSAWRRPEYTLFWRKALTL